jgi:hypothetical protein
MAHHIISVTLLDDGRVRTFQNPLTVMPSDTVEWRFVDERGQIIQDALIEFRGFLPMNRMTPIAGPQQQPFTVQLAGRAPKAELFSVASTDPGTYFYVIILDGQVLDWEVPLFTIGSFSSFFGGIIIRDPNT